MNFAEALGNLNGKYNKLAYKRSFFYVISKMSAYYAFRSDFSNFFAEKSLWVLIMQSKMEKFNEMHFYLPHLNLRSSDSVHSNKMNVWYSSKNAERFFKIFKCIPLKRCFCFTMEKPFMSEISFIGFQESIRRQRVNVWKTLQNSETGGNFLLQHVFPTVHCLFLWPWKISCSWISPLFWIFTFRFSETRLWKSFRETLECLMLGSNG